MMEINLRDQFSASLAAMPDRLHDALLTKANMLGVALQSKIQEKLSGSVLNQVSGVLARSITATIDDAATAISVRIGAGGDVKYAAIHEFGGIIPPHQIVPDKAKALAFAIGGKQVFAARVQIPAVTMPERSYMRSSLAEMADEIQQELSRTALEAMD